MCLCMHKPLIQPKVGFSVGAKALPLYPYIPKNENPNKVYIQKINQSQNFNYLLFLVYKSFFNGMLISQNSLYKCAILVFYATVVTYSISIYSLIKHMTHYRVFIHYMLQYIIIVCNRNS